jgi:hypothetical protein
MNESQQTNSRLCVGNTITALAMYLRYWFEERGLLVRLIQCGYFLSSSTVRISVESSRGLVAVCIYGVT